ncbi:MAG: ABC-F family ATP-binding cassette domain-containing protein [Cyclobacteriaceae bacterium]
MNILSAESLSKSFSERWLFQNINFGLNQGEKVALVGANGTGKSTLMKIIAGKLPADGGETVIRKGIKVAYLEQEPDLPLSATARDAVFGEDNPVAQTVIQYNAAIEDPNMDSDLLEELTNRMEELNAWDFDSEIEQVMGKLGVHDLEQVIDTMSGGQKKRVALAKLLLSKPDFLLLDEPTNHLDVTTIEWLEEYLKTAAFTILMVTHDRYFMDHVSNNVLELNNGSIHKHQGNYEYYLTQRAAREEQLATEVTKAKNLYKKELEWVRRQPKARGTKAKYRVEAFEGIKAKAKQDISKATMNIEVTASRQGKKILEIEGLNKQFDGTDFVKDFSYVFKRGERIAIVGENGVGKSTFLNLLTGQLEPDSGEIEKGQTTQFGYFTQHSESLNESNKVIQEVLDIAEYITLGDGKQITASKFLEMFLFTADKQYTLIEKLSGGERKKLQLLKVLVRNPNFLILDEPTNDLDIDTLNVLEEFLESFPGCLIIVSHDRYFTDRLIDHLFVFKGQGEIMDFNGNYTDYLEYKKEVAREEKQKKNKKDTAPKIIDTPVATQEVKKASYKEKIEFETLEKEIADLELEKKKIEEELSNGGTDFDKISELSNKMGEINNTLEEKELRWLELSEICG